MTIETQNDVDALKRVGRIVSLTLQRTLDAAQPGMTTREIDLIGERVIRAGDVLNVDVSAELDGYFADTGGTIVVPPTAAQKTRLCHATRTALAEAMKRARAGRPVNGIGAAIERTAHASGFKVIENLGSHGVGRALHEEPEHIAGYFDLPTGESCRRGWSSPSNPSWLTRQPLRPVRAHDDHDQGCFDRRDAALIARRA